MRFSRFISTVDTHTEGEPTRIITGGIKCIPGRTMVQKMEYFKSNLDHIRTALMAEPRGHKDMYGCLLTEPASEKADYGFIFMDNQQYMSGCGHATIGISTALAELGMVNTQEPITRMVLEPPSGLIEVEVKMFNGRAESVAFRNVPAFVEYVDEVIEVPGLGKLRVDVAFGGNYFVFFQARDVNLEVTPNNIEKVIDTCLDVKAAANQQLKVQHPKLPHNDHFNIATVLSQPNNPEADYLCVHVFSTRQFDHSPGGTGTSAWMAVLFSKGQIKLKEYVRAESITGGIFTGRLLEKTLFEGKPAVIPEITGSAFITGFHQFVIDDQDPIKKGFLIGH
ncbi:MAG: proline racemase family protein [Deltaproteobacteria bacterium]|nr:MAG: proline racemase family protein [Deltaproteobacteria bacterium]